MYLQNNSLLKPLEEQVPQGTIFCMFRERCNALEERPSELTGGKAAPQISQLLLIRIIAKHPIEGIVAGSSMAIFKICILSSQ